MSITNKHKLQNMKKSLLLLFAAFATLMTSAQTKVEIDGIWYSLLSKTKQAEVVSNPDGSTEYIGDIIIPSTVTYENTVYEVTSIGASSFDSCEDLASIVIPESVTNIGNWAFWGCSQLTNIVIPKSVLNLGEEAFRSCKRLISITIPESITEIKSGTFESCTSLTSITIPKSVTKIWDRAFAHCTKLTSITYFSSFTVEGVEGTYDPVFYGCYSSYIDMNVHIPNIESWLSFKNPFEDFAKNIRLYKDGEELTEVEIPSGITSIPAYSFKRCSNLTTIHIPEGITRIEESAFNNCSSLRTITIPTSITNIERGAFRHCNSLAETHIQNLENWCNITFEDTDACPLLYSKSLYLNGEPITNLVIPNTITTIKEYAFYGISNLSSVLIPESVTSIGAVAFRNCNKLTSISLPYNLSSIGDGAFSNCGELLDVYCYAESVPSTKANAFDGSYSEYAILHVPTSALDVYKTTEPWSSFGTIKSLTNELVTEITLSQQAGTMTEGGLLMLTATIAPIYATDCSITWSSSNSNVACVDANGTVKALSPGTAVITATANDGSGVSASCEVIVEARRTSITIVDPYVEDCFVQGESEENIDITYTRAFDNTAWQSLYVPFEIPVTEELLEDFEIADLNDIRQYDRNDDGIKDETVVEAFKVKSGATLAANYPYLIRAIEAGEKTITVTDATLFATEEVSIDCSSIREKFTFTGTYSRKASSDIAGCYALYNGVWQPLASDATLGAFRVYLKIESRDNNVASAREIRIHVVGDTTDIDELESSNGQQPTVVYDLQGRRIMDTDNLKGVYIVNGKKVAF